jgi:hypothetical protein
MPRALIHYQFVGDPGPDDGRIVPCRVLLVVTHHKRREFLGFDFYFGEASS